LGVIAVFLFASVLRADDVTVTLVAFPPWTQIAPNTFVMPANQNQNGVICGVENEPLCELPAVFSLNVGIVGAPPSGNPVNFFVLEPNGKLSDFISISNDSQGHGLMTFESDGGLTPTPGFGTPGGVLCIETDSGCIASLTLHTTNGSTITVTGAFDGESSFDPFGAGFDTSDGLKVTTGVPEPGSFALLASGLVGLAGMLRKKLLSR
jgi:hypothetical protein